jgi:hypothetical protein
MSGHLSVGEELVSGQGPFAAKQKEDHQSPIGGDKGQVCSSHQFQKALIAAIVYTLVYINLNPM